ncbi:MAG: amino acid ABC transporter permease [Spirochaetales bacterium]|nr:amino acid ABC transporter permease [Spirochaetales bacterium]
MNVLSNLDFATAIHDLLPKLLGQALSIVVLATILGFLLGLVFAFLLALARISKLRVLKKIVVLFQELIRGTPLLVQLVYIYYVVPLLIELVAQLCGAKGYHCHMSSLTAGVIGLAVNYGTYMSEVIRAAILSIDKGQTEASLALGLSPHQAMFRIVIPQAISSSIPVFGNYLVMMVKDTSLMAYITVPEFLLTTKAYTSQTFLTIESYTILAVVYLIICIPLSILSRYLENRTRVSSK